MPTLVRHGTALLFVALIEASLSGQTVRLVTITVDLPNGAHPILTVADGAVATLTLTDAGTFGFRPRVRDPDAGIVTVTILNGGAPDSLTLAEVDLTVGATPVQSGTSPSFGVAVERIVQK